MAYGANLDLEPPAPGSPRRQYGTADSRLLQAKVIADAASAATEPIVLTGDLNATPEAPEITTLTALLTDSHAAAGHGDGFTYPVEAPTNRIDYVLTDRAFPVWSRVLATASSDHRPVLARVIAGLDPAGQAA